jgi:hypothetical protein
MTESPLWPVGCVVFGVIAIFFVAFALKVAVLEWWSRQEQPGGFEVKLAGAKPDLKEKEIDHG